MNEKIINYLSSGINENNLSHAFLIETNSILNTEHNIFKIFYDKGVIDKQKDISINLSIKEVFTDENIIDKTKILDLQKFTFKTNPNGKYKLYFILNAEKMNVIAQNKLLKVLEEPSDDTIGFLICNSKEQILDTIKSRCVNFLDTNYIEANVNRYTEIFNELDTIFNISYVNWIKLKQNLLNYDRIDLIKLFNFYLKYLQKNNSENHIKSFLIYNNFCEILNSNVNIELQLDKLYIELRK